MADNSSADNRRKYHRNATQRVVIILDNTPYLAVNWSPDGFSIEYPDKKLNPGDEISGYIDVFELEEMGEFKGLVVRHDNNVLAVEFTHLCSHVFMNLCINLHQTDEDTID